MRYKNVKYAPSQLWLQIENVPVEYEFPSLGSSEVHSGSTDHCRMTVWLTTSTPGYVVFLHLLFD